MRIIVSLHFLFYHIQLDNTVADSLAGAYHEGAHWVFSKWRNYRAVNTSMRLLVESNGEIY